MSTSIIIKNNRKHIEGDIFVRSNTNEDWRRVQRDKSAEYEITAEDKWLNFRFYNTSSWKINLSVTEGSETIFFIKSSESAKSDFGISLPLENIYDVNENGKIIISNAPKNIEVGDDPPTEADN